MVTIVIPAYNEEDKIGATLDSLVKQSKDVPFEVIVVNNNSTDNTAKIAKAYKNKLNLRVIDEPRKGRGKARATGFEHAKGDIILSLDADTKASKNWVKNMNSHFDDPKVVAVTGTWKMNSINPITAYLASRLQTVVMIPYVLIFGNYWLTGFNFGIRKSIYDRCGGFNKRINAIEDIDLALRVRKYGKIKYVFDSQVITSGRRYEKGLLQGIWEYQKGTFNYFVLDKQKDLLDDKR